MGRQAVSRVNLKHTVRIILASLVLWVPAGCRQSRSTIPERLANSTFWSLVAGLSEPGGYFHSDNLVSNELAFQYVLPELKDAVGGDVYIGVGPDQNFTYLVNLRPRIAFIVDIRRQNLVQHLMYKALIEMSRDRADFLVRLFSRGEGPPPPPDSVSAAGLFSWLALLPRDSSQYIRNLSGMRAHLKQKGFFISPSDSSALEYVYASFFRAGPALTYSAGAMGRFGSRGMPSYRTLMTQTDPDGVNRSYLGSERNFRILQDMQKRNLIVPVVGDFAGSKALRSVGEWVRRHHSTIRTFYVSNVEQYLFQQDDAWRRFYSTVSEMPMDRQARFIRSVPTRGMGRQLPTARSASRTSSVAEVLDSFQQDRLLSYRAVVELSR